MIGALALVVVLYALGAALLLNVGEEPSPIAVLLWPLLGVFVVLAYAVQAALDAVWIIGRAGRWAVRRAARRRV